MLFRSVRPLSALSGNGASVIEITVEATKLSIERLEELRNILLRFPGPSCLRLHLNVTAGAQVTIAASPEMTVTLSESLRHEVEALLGPGTLTVV